MIQKRAGGALTTWLWTRRLGLGWESGEVEEEEALGGDMLKVSWRMADTSTSTCPRPRPSSHSHSSPTHSTRRISQRGAHAFSEGEC